MDQLPKHGRIDCTKCFQNRPVEFGKTIRSEMGWRITANPLAWGNQDCEVIVLGFSKGPTQAGALADTPHDEIAYKGSRLNVGRILSHIGLLQKAAMNEFGPIVSTAIKDKTGRFHFGSLIRCAVERYDESESAWKGSGGGMLDKFVATRFGQEVARNCTGKYLGSLPVSTKLVVMFGLGTGLNYVQESFKLYLAARGGNWKWLNKVAYTDGKIVVVHVEHFASQGALIPDWMGKNNHPRGQYGKMAEEAVKLAIGTRMPFTVMPEVAPAQVSVAESSARAKDDNSSVSAHRESSIDDIGEILGEVKRAGYGATNENKKLAAFRSPGGHTLYVVKTASKLNNIILMAHPGLKTEILRAIDGVDSVSSEVRFHSNMTQFPKRLNGGKNETTYGWQVKIATLSDLPRFLGAFKALIF